MIWDTLTKEGYTDKIESLYKYKIRGLSLPVSLPHRLPLIPMSRLPINRLPTEIQTHIMSFCDYETGRSLLRHHPLAGGKQFVKVDLSPFLRSFGIADPESFMQLITLMGGFVGGDLPLMYAIRHLTGVDSCNEDARPEVGVDSCNEDARPEVGTILSSTPNNISVFIPYSNVTVSDRMPFTPTAIGLPKRHIDPMGRTVWRYEDYDTKSFEQLVRGVTGWKPPPIMPGLNRRDTQRLEDGFEQGNDLWEMQTSEIKLAGGFLQFHRVPTCIPSFPSNEDEDSLMALGSMFDEKSTTEQDDKTNRAERPYQTAYLKPFQVLDYLNKNTPTPMDQCVYDGDYVYIPHPESIITMKSDVVFLSTGLDDSQMNTRMLAVSLRDHRNHLAKYRASGFVMEHTTATKQLLTMIRTMCIGFRDPQDVIDIIADINVLLESY